MRKVSLSYSSVLCVAFMVFVVALAWLFLDIRHMRAYAIGREGTHMRDTLQQLREKEPLGSNDIDLIEEWMTFDYINKIFGLPSDYVKTQLQITDSRYPRISLSGYARNQHIDVATLLNSVADAVRNYLITK